MCYISKNAGWGTNQSRLAVPETDVENATKAPEARHGTWPEAQKSADFLSVTKKFRAESKRDVPLDFEPREMLRK